MVSGMRLANIATMFWVLRRISYFWLGSIMLLNSVAPGQIWARANASSTVSNCLGSVHVVPGAVHIGAFLTISGQRFSCRTPIGTLFPVAAVIIYQQRLGFLVVNAHIKAVSAKAAVGSWMLKLRMPATLTAANAISGGPLVKVATKPGMYYVSLRLSDLAMPPPSETQAHFLVLR